MKKFLNKMAVYARNMTCRIGMACILIFLLFSTTKGAGLTPVQAQVDPGTIAYVRPSATGDEIRLIEPDGSADRLLWKTNVPEPGPAANLLPGLAPGCQ